MKPEDIQKMIEASLEKSIASKRSSNDVKLNAAQESADENEFNPQWAKDTAVALNGLRAFGRGERGEAEDLMNTYKSRRSKMSDTQKATEERAANEIVKNSGLGKVAQFRALNTSTNSEGGFLLPKPFLAEVFVSLEEYGVARREFRGVPMTSETMDLKDVATKPTVFWTDQLSQIGESEPTFGENQLVAKKLAALMPWAMELQEDSAFAVIPLAAQLFAEAFAEAEDRAGFTGSGAGDTANAEFTGMLYGAGKEVTVGGATYADITWDDVLKAIHSLSPAQRRGAKIYVATGVLGELRGQKGSDGQYVYKSPVEAGGVGNAWGYPIVETQVLPDTDTAVQTSSRFAVVGNPNNMLFGTRGGAEFRVFEEGSISNGAGAVTFSAVQNDGSILRVKERIGFAVTQPNNICAIKTTA